MLEKQAFQMSEQKLAERIIYLHEETGLGFRRVARQLKSEGVKIGKDKAHRLYRKYKNRESADVEGDEEMRELKETEKEVKKRLRLAREKDEIRKGIAALFVEEAMTSFERRKELFSDENELLDFADKVMSVVDPPLWDGFKELCEEQGYDLANAVATAIGKQRDYEKQLAENVGPKPNLDLYFRERIGESLDAWKEDEKEESLESADNTPEIIIEDDEFVYIQI